MNTIPENEPTDIPSDDKPPTYRGVRGLTESGVMAHESAIDWPSEAWADPWPTSFRHHFLATIRLLQAEVARLKVEIEDLYDLKGGASMSSRRKESESLDFVRSPCGKCGKHAPNYRHYPHVSGHDCLSGNCEHHEFTRELTTIEPESSPSPTCPICGHANPHWYTAGCLAFSSCGECEGAECSQKAYRWALRVIPYVQHTEGCEAQVVSRGRPCTCGLTDAMGVGS